MFKYFKKDFWKEFDYKTHHTRQNIKTKKVNRNINQLNPRIMRDCPAKIKAMGEDACKDFERKFMKECPKKFIDSNNV